MSTEAKKQSETVPIENVEQFVSITCAWHTDKVKVLEHMLAIPEGTKIEVSGQAEATLTGDMLAGFRAGIELSLMQLGTLPFAIELEEAPSGG